MFAIEILPFRAKPCVVFRRRCVKTLHLLVLIIKWGDFAKFDKKGENAKNFRKKNRLKPKAESFQAFQNGF